MVKAWAKSQMGWRRYNEIQRTNVNQGPAASASSKWCGVEIRHGLMVRQQWMP